MFLIAVPAVDGSVTIGFEGNLGFLSAICTGNIVHFTGCAIIPTSTIGSFSFFHYFILPLFYLWAPCFLGAAGLPYTNPVFNLMDIALENIIKSYL
jgi:hypothetical protein